MLSASILHFSYLLFSLDRVIVTSAQPSNRCCL